MIVILTALELEHAAVRAHLVDVELHSHPSGTLFDVGVLATCPDRRIALALIGMGNPTSAALTERAIAEFQPDIVMFVGIAGGLRTWLALGDVVVATRIYGYHGGRSEADEFRARPRAWDTPHHVEQLARHVARSAAWRRWLPDADDPVPNVYFEPIAAGEVVLNSTKSPLAEQIRTHYNDAVAVEMESAGVAHASHLNMATPTVTVRGISDLVDAKDTTDRAGWQPVAARNAAAFAMALAAELGEAGNRVNPARPSEQNHGRAQHVENNNYANYAFGDVGTQIGSIGSVTGNLAFGAQPRTEPPPPPPDHVGDLTLAVMNAHHTGRVDTDTFVSAIRTLDEVRSQLAASPAHQDPTRFADTIRRLDTLLGGVPELRAKVRALEALRGVR